MSIDIISNDTLNELDQEILRAWNILEDIQLILSATDIEEFSKDDLQNSLIGIHTLYELKFQKLYETYNQLTHQIFVTKSKIKDCQS